MRGWLAWSLVAVLLTGCAIPGSQQNRTLEKEAVTVSLPSFEPDAGDFAPIRQIKWDGSIEKQKSEEGELPPPLPMPRVAGQGDKKGKKGKESEVAPTPPTVPGPRINLWQAIQMCLAADPRLRASAEDLVQSQADLVTASLKPNPTLDISQTLLPLFRAFTVDEQGGPPQLDVQVSYPIDWCLFGKRDAAVAAARLGIHVSEYEYANSLRERIQEVVLAFYDVLEARALVTLARQDVANLKRIEQTLEKAVKAGGKAVVDLNRIRLDRLKSEQTLREAESTLAINRTKLRALLGCTAAPPVDVEGSLEGEVDGGEVSVEELFQLALKMRPDIRAAHAEVGRRQADIEVEDRNAYPEVTPRAGYTHQFQKTTIGFPDADAWGVGVAMTLPCHNRNQGNRLKARSLAVQKQYEFQTKVVELRAEIEQLVQEYTTAKATARAVTGEQVRLAAQIRDAISQAYQAGGRPLLDFLDAQRSYRETYRLQVTSRANYYRAVYRLHIASGAGIKR